MQYNTDLFDAAHVACLADHLVAFIGDCGANPLKKISEASLMSRAEQKLVLHQWNSTEMKVPEGMIKA